VFGVHGDDGGWEKDRGAIGAADEDVGLATVAKSLQDMGRRKEIPLLVDEETVAKEAVVVATRGGGLVQLIDDGADGGGEMVVVGKGLRHGTNAEAADETGK
jgi:hypothetical protein